MGSRHLSLSALAVVPFLLLILSNCSSKQLEATQTVPRGGKTLLVISSGDLHGYISPCGCTKPMFGGLMRRGTLLDQLEERGPTVRLENGDITKAANRQDQIKAETIVDILNEMKYDAINLGESDFLYGVQFIRSLQERFSGAFLCANVLENGTPIALPFTVVEREAGSRKLHVGVIGVISSTFSDTITGSNPSLMVTPPETSVRDAVSALGQVDTIVLVYHGPINEANELRKQFPAISLVVFSEQDDPKEDGTPELVCAGKRGRMLAVTEVGEGGRAMKTEYPKLGPEYLESKKVKPLVQAYLNRLTQENLLATFPKTQLASGEGFAGSSACVSCHTDEHKTWLESKHSTALETLEEVGHDEDPECVSCHVVGLDKKGGFQSKKLSPNLAGVGCESCHGPSKQHANDPVRFRTPAPAKEQCLTCHVPDHSPKFDYGRYWEKIKH